MLDVSNKFLKPIIDRNSRIKEFTKEEKLNYIKNKYGLHHGKGIRKYKKKKHK